MTTDGADSSLLAEKLHYIVVSFGCLTFLNSHHIATAEQCYHEYVMREATLGLRVCKLLKYYVYDPKRAECILIIP